MLSAVAVLMCKNSQHTLFWNTPPFFRDEFEMFWQDCCPSVVSIGSSCRGEIEDKTHTSCSKNQLIDTALITTHTLAVCMSAHTSNHQLCEFIRGFISHYLHLICLWACLNCCLTLFRLPAVLLIPPRPLGSRFVWEGSEPFLSGDKQHQCVCWFSQEHCQASEVITDWPKEPPDHINTQFPGCLPPHVFFDPCKSAARILFCFHPSKPSSTLFCVHSLSEMLKTHTTSCFRRDTRSCACFRHLFDLIFQLKLLNIQIYLLYILLFSLSTHSDESADRSQIPLCIRI